MYWIETFGKGFVVCFGPDVVQDFDSLEEAEEYITEMNK